MLMLEGNLRPSLLWFHLMWNAPQTLYPLVKDLVSYAWIRRGFEIICGTRFLTSINDVERRFRDTSMSNVKFNMPDPEEAVRLQSSVVKVVIR